MALFGKKKPRETDGEGTEKKPSGASLMDKIKSVFGRSKAKPSGEVDVPDTNSDTQTDSDDQKKGLSATLKGMFKKKPKDASEASASSDTDEKKPLFSFLKKKEGEEDKKPVKDAEIDYDQGNIIEVDGKQVAVGLFWNTKQPEDKIKVLAADLENVGAFDIYSLFSMDRQVGFAASEEGYKAGQLVGVSLFSKSMQTGTWFGAFPVDTEATKYWLVAIRDGQVYQDSFFTSVEQARDAFDSEARASGWTDIYAPDAWGVGGTNETPLSKLVDIKRGKKLKFISPIRANLGRIIMAVIVSSLLGGGFYYYQYTVEQERLAQEELQRLRSEQLRQAQADIPWRTYMDPTEFYSKCSDLMETYTVFAPGWSQSSFTCSFERDSIRITTGWSRAGGRIAYLRSLMPEEAPRLFLDASGNRVEIEISQEIEVRDLTNQVTPWAPQRLTRILAERFQTMGLPIDINQVTQRVNTQNRGRQQQQPQATFNYHALRFSTSVAVEEYFRLLSDVPAVLPEQLEYDFNAGRWTVVARAYHPPIGL